MKNRRLIILRHAKSAWDDPGLDDFERPLAPRGESEMPLMARWLADQKIHIGRILCSPAKRTRQSAKLLCGGAGLSEERIEYRDELYLASCPTLLDIIGNGWEESGDLLVIGHNPGLEELLRYLCGDDLPLTNKGKLLTTANLAIVALTGGWRTLEPRSGQLLTLIRPAELQNPDHTK